MSLEETRQGAMNRARNAYDRAQKAQPTAIILGVGIESGIFRTEGDRRGYDVCIVSAFDGDSFNQGMSCAFEIPPPIMKFVEQGLDLSKACHAAGVTANPKLGEAEGLIGILSRGRVTRMDYTVQALLMAFMFLENRALFTRSDESPARLDCVARLGAAAGRRNGTRFELPLTAFLAAFGEPGTKAYGTHEVTGDGAHVVKVQSKEAVQALLGDSPAATVIGCFTLHYDGRQTAEMHVERARGQSDLLSSLANGAKPTKQEAWMAAAAAAATDSQKEAFEVDSAGDSETEAGPCKKMRRVESEN
eukprot:TRINITY_DN4435_c0_g1_i3.p1 TRINITY_DN4435_c0_g1~~TRINITY_DN4435_c0_g1_i3.p1  ORF type:complete len:304 (+),score=64.44 TRINITY_DN4435_c0_g1_i3:191-1102(+)